MLETRAAQNTMCERVHSQSRAAAVRPQRRGGGCVRAVGILALACHQLNSNGGGGSRFSAGHAFNSCRVAWLLPSRSAGTSPFTGSSAALPSWRPPPPPQLVARRHGPSGPLDWLIERLVPQPGPQWVPAEPPPDALQEEPLPLEAVEGVSAEELAWREFLVALVPYGERLADQVDAAEEHFLQRENGDNAPTPSPPQFEPATGTEETAQRAVFRSVWANLGDAREVVRSFAGDMSLRVARSRAWRGDFGLSPSGVCDDIAGLEAAIVNAWTAKCDPEFLWAAQALLGACRRYSSPSAASRSSGGQLIQG
mmetsp:Transcript_19851/g.49950  ORF Transcript_19851/g.49950 Transcript_19851/m.49950 type:complete len:310 (+) Transcript_19851:48-977(+)